MSSPQHEPVEAPYPDDEFSGTPSGDLSAQLIRLIRLVNSVKVHAAAKQRHGVEFTSYVLLFQLVRRGPQRLSSLAECVHSDVSTVSRQVSALVDHGLIEKRPDANDRRAALLAATDDGLELFRTIRRERNAMFDAVLQNWSAQEITALATMLSRFNDDFGRHHESVLRRSGLHSDGAGPGVPPDTPGVATADHATAAPEDAEDTTR